MKKSIAVALTIAMLFAAVSALAQEQDIGLVVMQGIEQVVDPVPFQPGTEITVGLTTPMSGMFGSDLFGYNTADMDVRALIHGYSTVAWTRTHGMTIDGNVIVKANSDLRQSGNRVYTLTLSDRLFYNDGTPITAKDYIFTLLLSGSPIIHELGGTPIGRNDILGYSDYMAGTAEAIAGVRLLSDREFTIEVETEGKPFFYGFALINVQPSPMSVIAPGCDIVDGDGGARIVASADAAAMDAAALGFTPGVFDAAMLRKTLLDPDTGYASNPKVTCGPYTLESFDKAAAAATFVANPQYIGNYEGQKPHIERVHFTVTTNETMIDELLSGKLTLINKVANAESADNGIAATAGQSLAKYVSYPRTGFTFLAFACELGATSSSAVRLAVAHALDKRSFASDMITSKANPTQIYGLPVFGYYGMGQWMFNQIYAADPAKGYEAVDTVAFVDTLETNKDMDLSKKLLADDGWTLNEKGEAFAEGTDKVRYRKEGEALVPLLIRCVFSEGSALAKNLRPQLEEALPALGFELDITELPYNDAMKHYYRQTERTYNLFLLASNFNYVFDPYYDFNTADAYQGMINTTGIRDEELMARAKDMRETEPSNQHGYLLKWQAFQKRFSEVMPMIPLYCNLYFDFYQNNLQGYDIVTNSGWALAIPYAYIADEPYAAEAPALPTANP